MTLSRSTSMPDSAIEANNNAGMRAAARIRAAHGSNRGTAPPQRSAAKAIPNTTRYGSARPNGPTNAKNGRAASCSRK